MHTIHTNSPWPAMSFWGVNRKPLQTTQTTATISKALQTDTITFGASKREPSIQLKTNYRFPYDFMDLQENRLPTAQEAIDAVIQKRNLSTTEPQNITILFPVELPNIDHYPGYSALKRLPLHIMPEMNARQALRAYREQESSLREDWSIFRHCAPILAPGFQPPGTEDISRQIEAIVENHQSNDDFTARINYVPLIITADKSKQQLVYEFYRNHLRAIVEDIPEAMELNPIKENTQDRLESQHIVDDLEANFESIATQGEEAIMEALSQYADAAEHSEVVAHLRKIQTALRQAGYTEEHKDFASEEVYRADPALYAKYIIAAVLLNDPDTKLSGRRIARGNEFYQEFKTGQSTDI